MVIQDWAGDCLKVMSDLLYNGEHGEWRLKISNLLFPKTPINLSDLISAIFCLNQCSENANITYTPQAGDEKWTDIYIQTPRLTIPV